MAYQGRKSRPPRLASLLRVDAGRVDTVLKVGGLVLLRSKELLDTTDMGKAAVGRTRHRHGLPEPQRLHVDLPPAAGPVSDPGQESEHEVGLLLNRKTKRGATRYLVRWRGHKSADDERLHCPEKAADYDAVAPPRRPRNAGPPVEATRMWTRRAPPVAQAGLRFAVSAETGWQGASRAADPAVAAPSTG